MSRAVTILTGEPVIACIAEMSLDEQGMVEMLKWVADRRPDCVPPAYSTDPMGLFPHKGFEDIDGHTVLKRRLTGNELLVELAGRKCYNSLGVKAGQRTNKGYIENTQRYDPPHRSIMYHAKMSFFIGGVSRRVSHELIRHYVGADRDEEGSPSQESTRYTEHTGHYVAHPRILGDEAEMHAFKMRCQRNYDEYLDFVQRNMRSSDQFSSFKKRRVSTKQRKRVLEAASADLKHSIETSFVWTTNPIALAKMFKERDNEAADLEYLRFAKAWKRLCVSRWPNLFPQPWMRD